jgi:hypothetical protein
VLQEKLKRGKNVRVLALIGGKVGSPKVCKSESPEVGKSESLKVRKSEK